MSHQLINLSPDLKRLWDEGIDIEIKNGHLLVHKVPYLNSSKEIKYGTLVSTLNLAGNVTCKPETHAIYFIGDAPCHKDGSVFSEIIHSSANKELVENVVVNHLFSSRPQDGYSDYYEKICTYINIIPAPAKSIDDSVTEKTFKVIKPDGPESVFKYFDTNSIKAEISTIAMKFENQKIAIIGLGGTGSYILDLVSKTPVKEIHLYDGDIFFQHNAFRAPGAISIEQLREQKRKTDYFKEIYSNMHQNIISHNNYINDSNIETLSGMDYVFICIDKSEIKKLIFDYLEKNNTPFIDVGMGVQNVDNKLIGVVRITSSTEKKRDHTKNRISFTESEDNEYSKNIQVADLNCLNAALAVIKWKKLCGFYYDCEKENHCTYSTNLNMLTSDDNDS
jgi:hypothetical protein